MNSFGIELISHPMKVSQLQAKWKQPFYEQIVLLQSWAEKPSASHPTMKNYNLCSKKIRGLLHHGDTTGPNKFLVAFEKLCNIFSKKYSFDKESLSIKFDKVEIF